MSNLKVGSVLAGVLMSLGAASSAQAFAIVAGNYKITIDAHDSATTTYAPAGPGVKCVDIATCNAAGIPPALGSIGSVNPGADTLGIFSVASITNIVTSANFFTRGVDGFLTGIFSNLTDFYVENTGLGGATTNTNASGGTFKMWLNAADFNPLLGPTVAVGKDLNAHLYPGISGGALYLEGNFASGIGGPADAVTTWATNFNSTSLVGGGAGYLDFTGGSALANFNTDSHVVAPGVTRDALAQFTFSPIGAASGWTVVATGDIRGNVIPEPGSLALVAFGLLAAGGLARRKQA
ncbi:MAG: PEP-CTERM sorting domain-containing protein [Rubrivivax sp.]|nr:PEP-CTERM sorting domain-containing protein [Rubrivivax sp.]